MRYSLEEVHQAIKSTLEHWKIESPRYLLELRQDQLEIWSFDNEADQSVSFGASSPCRFLITPTDESLTDPDLSPEFYIVVDTANDSHTYKGRYSSPDRLVKMIIVLREGQRDFRGLLHRSDKGFAKEELERKRRR